LTSPVRGIPVSSSLISTQAANSSGISSEKDVSISDRFLKREHKERKDGRREESQTMRTLVAVSETIRKRLPDSETLAVKHLTVKHKLRGIKR
jgi:hypothetical protein